MRTTFHALHHADRPLVLPNAWDFASAAAMADAGFQAIGTTSLGVAAAHGLPDAEGLGRDETVALAARLVRLPLPITVDVEAGFGDPVGVVAELADLRVAGVNLGDGLGDAAAQAEVIRAVKQRAPDVFLNARIDTHWLREPMPAEMFERAQRYAQAGADGIFVPGLDDPAHIRALADLVDLPLNVLCSPHRGVDELRALGVRRISTGSLLFRSALRAAVTAARELRAPATGAFGYADVQRMIARS